ALRAPGDLPGAYALGTAGARAPQGPVQDPAQPRAAQRRYSLRLRACRPGARRDAPACRTAPVARIRGGPPGAPGVLGSLRLRGDPSLRGRQRPGGSGAGVGVLLQMLLDSSARLR